MNLTEIVQKMLGYQRPPSPRPETDRALPTPEDIRWAKLRADALIRRARDLEIDVQLEIDNTRVDSSRHESP